MDTLRGFDDDRATAASSADEGVGDPRPSIGTDERRMHVRAYNHWVSLLKGRAYPTVEDLDPAAIVDFGPHSVLLDFTEGVENPAIRYLGKALREECGLPVGLERIGQVPGRSLLSRLTDHYLQIIANRAPIGFEAEFVGQRGFNTLYRGILMPFSSDGEAIDFIYGVINWKELVDANTQAALAAEVEAAVLAPQPVRAVPAPVWADGPMSEIDDLPADMPAIEADASLADRLGHARACAEAADGAHVRSRAALYRALAEAHTFAQATESAPEDYAELLADAGIVVQARAPMTAVAKLVFGTNYDKTRLTEFAAVLDHAKRLGVAPKNVASWIDATLGGIKGLVRAERVLRRPEVAPRHDPIVELRKAKSMATIHVADVPAGEFVVLLGRGGKNGTVEIIAALAGDKGLTERAMRAATR